MNKIQKAIDALDGCDEYSLRHHISEISILIEGYAEAQSELAALREELAELKAQLDSLGEAAGQLRSELEDAESDNDTIADHNIELQQRLAAAEQRNAELVELLRDTRDLIRPSAVLSPSGESARLKVRLDAALLNSPALAPGERIPGCADAAWLLYDGGFYGQHGVLVMDGATILQKAKSYAGYKPTESGASE